MTIWAIINLFGYQLLLSNKKNSNIFAYFFYFFIFTKQLFSRRLNSLEWSRPPSPLTTSSFKLRGNSNNLRNYIDYNFTTTFKKKSDVLEKAICLPHQKWIFIYDHQQSKINTNYWRTLINISSDENFSQFSLIKCCT